MSLPMSCRIPDWDAAGGYEIIDIGHDQVTTLEWRDATISLGYYFIVLSTEYSLLGTSGQDLSNTLIELYYALNALNRLDQFAEGYLDQTGVLNSSDLNGFLLRDDIPSGFENNWLPETLPSYYPIQDGNPTLRVDSDYQGYDYGPHFDFNNGNQMSLDQLTTLLLGLRFVWELVDNVYVQPTSEDIGFFIKTEAQNIIYRIITHMNDIDPNWLGLYSQQEWQCMNNDLLTPRGYDCTLAAYPWTSLCNRIWGGDFANLIFQPGDILVQFDEYELCETLTTDLSGVLINASAMLVPLLIDPYVGAALLLDLAAWSVTHCSNPTPNKAIAGPIPIEIPSSTIYQLWESLESMQAPIYVGSEETVIFNTSGLTIKLAGVEISLPQFIIVDVGWLEKATDEDNIHMMLEQALTGSVWNSSYIKYIGDNSQMYHAALMSDVLSNPTSPTPLVSTTADRTFIRDILTSAPCEGPWADPYAFPATSADCAPGGWGGPNRLFQPDNGTLGPKGDNGNGDANYRGYYPGLDYMVYYNLYHLLWRNEPEMPDYIRKVGCDCINEITEEVQIISELEVLPYFESYRKIGIPNEDYLGHDLTVSSELGLLKVKNDMVICGGSEGFPTKLKITNNAAIELYSDNSIIVRENNILEIDNGSILRCGIPYFVDGELINDISSIILEKNAELRLLNGSTLESQYGVRIEADQGAKIVVDGSNVFFNSTSSGSKFILHGQNTSFDIVNNSVFICNDNNGQSLSMSDNSELYVSNSYIQLPSTSWIIYDYSNLTIFASELDVSNSILQFGNRALCISEESFLNFENSEIDFSGDSEFHQIETAVILSEESQMSFLKEPGIPEPSTYYFSSGPINLIGNNARLTFDGGILNIPSEVTFQPLHESVESGYIEFTGQNDHELFTGENSKLLLIGDNINDVILKINNQADLWNANFGKGTLEIRNATVDLTNSGQLWTDMKFIADNVKFIDTNPPAWNEASTVQVWHNTACGISNCKFENTKLYTYNTRLSAYGTDFTGTLSGCKVDLGSLYVSNCDFQDCSLRSQSLAQNSSVVSSYFDPKDSMFGIEDRSNIEFKVSTSTFTDSNVGGIYKEGGKLTLKCNLFSDLGLAVIADIAQLNMSSTSFAGYNKFSNVETCITLNAATGINLTKGYNDLSGYSDNAIEGVLDYPCTNQQCAIQVDALGNYWGLGGIDDLQYPNGLIQPLNANISVLTIAEPYDCSGGGDFTVGCDVIFTDNEPVFPQSCGNGHISVIPPRRNQMVSSLTKPEINFYKDYEVDSGNPLINTSSFTDINLDSALITAAMMMEAYDSLGNDAIAIDLFHQILMDSLNRGITEVRWKMEWGQIHMKSALENMFLQDELSTVNNIEAFEPEVQKYVNVLNEMTDLVLTDSTFQSQFYLEMDKGQLFRTLNRPFMARYLFTHLDDCQLDSLQQSTLNMWLEEVDREISLYNQYVLNGVSPDSLNYSVDTTQYNVPIQLGLDQYYFGTWIESPSDITFMSCSENAAYQILAIQKNGAFSLYPNPNSGQFYMEYMGQEGQVTIEIRDMIGNMVYSESKYLYPFDVIEIGSNFHLSNGSYSCSTVNSGSRNSSSFVVYR